VGYWRRSRGLQETGAPGGGPRGDVEQAVASRAGGDKGFVEHDPLLGNKRPSRSVSEGELVDQAGWAIATKVRPFAC
jgi:hypothetical protein